MSESYTKYKESVLKRLIDASGKKNQWENGVWEKNGASVEHILPLDGKNTKANRANAIKKYMRFDCKEWLPGNYKGLHQYAHHLNSSQMLCMMFFSSMVKNGKATDALVRFINDALGIAITTNSVCQFEYCDQNMPEFHIKNEHGELVKESEGTSFDFHIKDSNAEIFFETKLTERGFGKAKNDLRHQEKAKKYMELLPQELRNKVSVEDILTHYQLFRNIIRAGKENSYVVFITDGNNPATKDEQKSFVEKFGNPKRVIFTTWQEIVKKSPNLTLPFQFKAML